MFPNISRHVAAQGPGPFTSGSGQKHLLMRQVSPRWRRSSWTNIWAARPCSTARCREVRVRTSWRCSRRLEASSTYQAESKVVSDTSAIKSLRPDCFMSKVLFHWDIFIQKSYNYCSIFYRSPHCSCKRGSAAGLLAQHGRRVHPGPGPCALHLQRRLG